jgi:hypothetical protein
MMTASPSAAQQASADTSRALQALRKGRLHWCELAPGRRVQFRRPLETEMHRFLGGVLVEHVCEYVCAWEGFTEATLLGDAVGSSDTLPWDAELWAEYVRDHSDVTALVARAIADALEAHLKAREAAAKN